MNRLTAEQRAELDALAIPTEGGSLVDTCVVDDPRLAWMHDGGRRKEAFGPTYPSAYVAAAASSYLRARSFGPAVNARTAMSGAARV